jgi:hypothetical protein
MATSCDSITRRCAAHEARCRPEADQGGDMTIETLDRPIEPQSAIMKGN